MKKVNDIACFFTFSTTFGHKLAQILPQDHTQFDFFLLFAGFQCNEVGKAQGIQSILKTLIGIQ